MIKQATYIGDTKLDAPTARPTILLPTIIPQTSEVTACHREPMINRTSAIRITRLRPNLSPKIPPNGLATSANKLVLDVIRLLSSVVRLRSERSEPMATNVDEITPVLGYRVSAYPGRDGVNQYEGEGKAPTTYS